MKTSNYLIKNLISSAIFLFVFSTAAMGQLGKPSHYALGAGSNKLAGNGVVVIKKHGTGIWFATSGGVSVTNDEGATIQKIDGDGNMPKGGISALDIAEDGTIWVAAVYDTTIDDETLQAGGGLAYSQDNGFTWNYIKQPVDPNFPDSLGYAPTTTHVQNTTWDIAVHGSTVWIASWGGGFRKSSDYGVSWEVVPPDEFPFSAKDNLNHLGFSIVFDGSGNIWTGSAAGINKSTDNGKTWTNYTAQNGSGISGNFVVALGPQILPDRSVIWGATWRAEGEEEFYGVSKTENGGLTWETSLRDQKINNFAFNGEIVYALGDEGFFKSADFGKTWSKYPAVLDELSGEPLYTTRFYCAMADGISLWAGTADGLIKTENDGITWRIYRSFPEPGKNNEPETYAYPNPFSPARHNLLEGDGHVRIQYHTNNRSNITIEIFDFCMKRVTTIAKDKMIPAAGTYTEVWNGKNDYREIVANGVYFYKLNITGQGTYWGKIVVLD